MGVAVTELRKLAREYRDRAEEVFSLLLPNFFESVLFKGFMLNYVKADFSEIWKMTTEYLTLSDNWAHIDCFFAGNKSCKRYVAEFEAEFQKLVDCDGVFFRRAVAVFNLNFCLREGNIDKALRTLFSIRSGDYYCDMAIAWALSVAFVSDFEATLCFTEKHIFSDEIRKMTVAKCRDSFRLSDAQKSRIAESLNAHSGRDVSGEKRENKKNHKMG